MTQPSSCDTIAGGFRMCTVQRKVGAALPSQICQSCGLREVEHQDHQPDTESQCHPPPTCNVHTRCPEEKVYELQVRSGCVQLGEGGAYEDGGYTTNDSAKAPQCSTFGSSRLAALLVRQLLPKGGFADCPCRSNAEALL